MLSVYRMCRYDAVGDTKTKCYGIVKVMNRTYICIDLKSFYASVECVERDLDPLTTNLVVADPERSEKTICLAITPSMKALGIHNRCRVFEIPKSVEYIMAPPRMKLYMEYAANIYAIYLKYIAKEDIHVYSIDEAFMDVTEYLSMYGMTAKELSIRIMQDIFDKVGITATCGIGTNMYLAKVALDITAKHVDDHIGELTEESYQKTLWDHKPLTDFWRVGRGISNQLQRYGITTMRGIAEAPEDLLYRMFGVDAELLIDHAWGKEPTLMSDIKGFKAKTNSLTSGQVLACDYNHKDGKLVVKEMADQLCLDMLDKGLVTDSMTLHMGYSNALHMAPAHGTISFLSPINSPKTIIAEIEKLYDKIKDPNLSIRRIHLTCNRVMQEEFVQYDLFTDPEEAEKERKIQKAMLSIKKKYGNNAILRGMNFEEGATMRERNTQIGGHKSGE